MPQVKIMMDVKVPMRDGINLAANVYLPEGDSPFPVVLNRTPYIKDSSRRVKSMQEFVRAGYALVTQDVRGRGNSEGVFDPNFQEIEDGFDSLEWCGTQPWSSGKVGTVGGSYEGWTQVFPMRLQSPHHAAAFLMCTPSMNPFDEVIYGNGVPMPLMVMWTMMTSGKTMKEQTADLDWEAVLKVRPLKDAAKSLGLAESYFEERAQHETMDEYFAKMWSPGVLERTKVPCYMVSGWFDDDLKGTLVHFPAFGMTHPNPEVRNSQKLLIGPWPHRLSIDTGKLGDFDYGPQSVVPLYKEAVRWFDYWLKGIDNGVMGESRCRLFLMGSNRWIETNTFPVAESRQRSYLLAANGPSNTLSGAGVLGDLPGSSLKSTFTYNPERPAPTPFWKESFRTVPTKTCVTSSAATMYWSLRRSRSKKILTLWVC
jgi:uncharacterized protein